PPPPPAPPAPPRRLVDPRLADLARPPPGLLLPRIPSLPPGRHRQALPPHLVPPLRLAPIVPMFSEVGPMNLMPMDSHTSAKWAFSARKPYPGWMASQAVISAALRMFGMLR